MKLVAVIFTDMEGFTALMQSDEDLAFAKRAKYTGVLQEKHEFFGGEALSPIFDDLCTALQPRKNSQPRTGMLLLRRKR